MSKHLLGEPGLTATDENDNAATALVVYEVVDTIAPVIGILPNDTTINCAVAETTPTLDSTFFAVEEGCNLLDVRGDHHLEGGGQPLQLHTD